MKIHEAQQVFDHLCTAFRYDKATKSEIELWLQHLRTIPYAVAEVACWEIVRSPKFKFMPRFGEFKAFCDEVSNQGGPNSLGLGLGGKRTAPDHFGAWRQEQIVALGDREYWAYLTNPQVRDRFEQRWRDEWAGQTAEDAS